MGAISNCISNQKHNHMKKKSLFSIALFSAGVGFSQNAYFNEQAGTTTTFTVADINKITFSSGNIVVDSKSQSDKTYAISGFRHLTFQPMVTSTLLVDNSSSSLKLYPNPTTGSFQVNSSEPLDRGSIFDSMGKLVMSVSNPTQIDVSQLPSGQYHFVGYSDTQVFNSSFIKY